MELKTILQDLTLFPDWESRYTYLIDLGKNLPPMPEEEKTEANKVRGCTSQVWLTARWEGQGSEPPRLILHLDSDALIVKGLLALVYAAAHGQTRAQIATLNLPGQLAPTGLLQNLSPNRRNGFAGVLAHLKTLAG